MLQILIFVHRMQPSRRDKQGLRKSPAIMGLLLQASLAEHHVVIHCKLPRTPGSAWRGIKFVKTILNVAARKPISLLKIRKNTLCHSSQSLCFKSCALTPAQPLSFCTPLDITWTWCHSWQIKHLFPAQKHVTSFGGMHGELIWRTVTVFSFTDRHRDTDGAASLCVFSPSMRGNYGLTLHTWTTIDTMNLCLLG